jgi:hypothetical protein
MATKHLSSLKALSFTNAPFECGVLEGKVYRGSVEVTGTSF